MASFESKKVKYEYVQKYSAKPEKIFPLLCAVREMKWLPGWEYEMLYSKSGYNEEGCIFKTKIPYNTETIWVTTTWDTVNYVVEFVEYALNSLVVRFKISLKDEGSHTTGKWEFTFTPISEKGNKFVEGYTEEKFKQVMVVIEKAMNHFQETGKLLTFSK